MSVKGLGQFSLLLGVLGILHSAYTAFILRKSTSLESLPFSFTSQLTLASIVTILGICLSAKPFKEIGWAAQMRKVSIDSDPSHARTGFADLVGRGRVIWQVIGEDSEE